MDQPSPDTDSEDTESVSNDTSNYELVEDLGEYVVTKPVNSTRISWLHIPHP